MQIKVNSISHNQTQVVINPSTDRELTLFYSYSQLTACEWKNVYYRTEKFFSQTTTRHTNDWLAGEPYIPVSQDFLTELVENYDK